jgi:hypothetical protein
MKHAFVLLCLLVPFTAPAGTITFSDQSFNLVNYSTTPVFRSAPSDTVNWTQCSTCGNPGSALQVQITSPNGGAAGVGFLNNSFLYNPLTQGSILSIDASVDKNVFNTLPPAPPGQQYANNFRPLIEQDGLFFYAVIKGPPFTQPGSTGYATIGQMDLLAADFLQFDYTTGMFGTAHPDFAGDPILFGLDQSTSFALVGNPNNALLEADYDNLTLIVHNGSVEPTPDSGSTLLMLLVALTIFASSAVFSKPATGKKRCQSSQSLEDRSWQIGDRSWERRGGVTS